LVKEARRRIAAEQQTQILIDKIPLQIILSSMDGHIFYANPQALNDYKISKEYIGQHNMLKFYNDDSDRKAVVKELNEQGMIEQKIVLCED